ncbi:hypothetical protein HanRHA438_Chr01g0004621 [Helianthus annuus]|uniref:Uncharacterized protein n=1 Tax=Helianthus annuus TaxID=4232 RepID=A0A9K3H6L0_HELAN|nr:hypothetical protein HanXRQr2_Chr14g0633151 [Helianthus annuus]KAJ0655505.1 hypothetical protein HanLR1_Chr14g0525011 [Helianthus annuus]KAJ0839475.1 hypothetical protein HanPSC8_Chr14g0607261 [Helianthus annuus]KAJ0852819.1 hypothetical protein HanRHA438_Chr14g0644061 [Helianthus annuus]KAJ0946499.1 hypothetical protein HanRHA438_Chr01g0004621 [Helianthus annuus]
MVAVTGICTGNDDLLRVKVRNEYGLGMSELYTEKNREDPKRCLTASPDSSEYSVKQSVNCSEASDQNLGLGVEMKR